MVAFSFQVGVFLTFIWEGLLERRNYQPAVCERKDKEGGILTFELLPLHLKCRWIRNFSR